MARSTRSARTSDGPDGAVWPAVKSRWTTLRTARSRSGSSAWRGTRYGMRATAIFFFARVIRAAIVGSETRNARAMSGVATPHTRRRVSATWASAASAGWQQVKMSRSRSSGAGRGGVHGILASLPFPPLLARVRRCTSGSCPGSPSGSTSSGSRARSALSRRMASIARRLAAVVSQAAGLSGIPLVAQDRSAEAYASCTHSSARSRSRRRAPSRRAPVPTPDGARRRGPPGRPRRRSPGLPWPGDSRARRAYRRSGRPGFTGSAVAGNCCAPAGPRPRRRCGRPGWSSRSPGPRRGRAPRSRRTRRRPPWSR